jgi:hypothetical protein
MGGQEWKRNTLTTAFLLPGVVFAIVLVLNFFLLAERSSGGVGLGTLFGLVALWLGVSIPLVFFGAYVAYRKEVRFWFMPVANCGSRVATIPSAQTSSRVRFQSSPGTCAVSPPSSWAASFHSALC